jgi:hypothetical protein
MIKYLTLFDKYEIMKYFVSLLDDSFELFDRLFDWFYDDYLRLKQFK